MVKELTSHLEVEALPAEPPALDDPQLFINRELSWLAFNRRVLEEALDVRNPLLERVKFISICSNNLDEFFMVRVAGVVEQALAGIKQIGPDEISPIELLETIQTIVSGQSQLQRECLRNELEPQLRAAGIRIEPYECLTEDDRAYLVEYFLRQIYPVLTPQAIDASRPFPHISSLSLNMLILIRDELGEHVARLKIPPVVPRYIHLPDAAPEEHERPERRGARFVLQEEVIEANLHYLFPGKDVLDAYVFRLTRDADIDIRDGTTESLIKIVEEELDRRLFGFVVRLTIEPAMPRKWRDWLVERLGITEREVFIMDRPLGLADLMEIYRVDRPDLKDLPFSPRLAPAFLDPNSSVFELISRQEILLYHPYDSFVPVIELIRQASADPSVVGIKQTLYRIGQQSPIVDALLEARDDEKQVAVLVELKARFDEESNINWARVLERAGVHVAYGFSGLKTHSKLILVVRREGHDLKRYVHLGTGNYNPINARLYTDLSFMTTDEDIAADVSDVFNQLTGYSSQTEYRKLLVAPVNLRRKLVELIHKEAEHGRDGRIIFKMNSLSDAEMTRELYRASQAGVQIDLIVRGICCLRPDIPGVSENIRVVSLVGRFLEHARIYYFGHGGPRDSERIYAGSADLMPRNLDHRVETLFPIEEAKMMAYIRNDLLDYQLRDNRRAYDMQSDGSYVRRYPSDSAAMHDAQQLPGPRPPDVAPRSGPWAAG
jgi:polyphosphate kinase